MKKGRSRVRLALLMTCFFCYQCIAQDIAATPNNKISVLTEHLAPFQIVTENGVKGYSTDIVNAVFEASDLDYSIEALPWSLAFHRAKKETNACLYSLVRIPQREDSFQWVGQIATSTTSFYSLSNRNITIEKLSDARKYVTAVMKDDVAHHFLLTQGFAENESLYVLSNYDALLKLLAMPNRNIDFVILNDDLLAYRLQDSREAKRYQNVHKIEELTLNFYLGCSLSTPKASIDKLSRAMVSLEKNGKLPAIRKEWQKKMAQKKNAN